MGSRGYSIAVYEKAMPEALSFGEKLETARRCGFDRLELSVDESDGRLARLKWSAAQRNELLADIRDSGVRVTTMCLSGHRRFPLGSHDAAVRARGLDIMERALELAADLGIQIIQLAGYDVYYETSDTQTRGLFAENLAKSVEMAAEYGVLLGFETMETPFMDTTAKAMVYVNDLSSPYLGVYPDIGNLENAAVLYGHDVVSDLSSGRGHVFSAHLKETRPGCYRGMYLGRGGHTEYDRCLRELCAQGVRAYTGEFWYEHGLDYAEEMTRAAAFMRAAIEKALDTDSQ